MNTIDRVKITMVKLLHSPPWDVPDGYATLPAEQQTEVARSIGAEPEDILAAFAELGAVSSDERPRQRIAAYSALTPDEGRQLAREAIGSSLSDAGITGLDLDDVLLHLACLVPGSLRGAHDALVEEFYLYPNEIFRDADERTRDRLIERVETQRDTQALRTLAWISDDVVTSRFHQWRESPPDWEPKIGSTIRWAAKDAGWELTHTGERRLLYHPECYELLPVSEALVADVPGPVGVVLPHEERCGLDDRQMITLFDIDVTDPRLAFLAPGWERLRIATCEQCTGFNTVVTAVDGRVVSHPVQSSTQRVGAADAAWDLPQRRLALGPRRRSPFEAHVVPDYASQLGGFPRWEGQEPHPDCPTCERTMFFVGQLSIDDLFDDGAEGMIYAVLCQDCQLAATTYAQT